jgi:hypothetical protein
MKLLSWLLLSLLFVSPVFAKNNFNTLSGDPKSAVDILNKSESVYANLKIYTDSGKVIQSFSEMAHPHKTAEFFKTAYANTGNFNFEYYNEGKSNSLYIINRSANIIKTWWGITNETKTQANMNLALAGASGVSARTAYFIPGLLLTKDLKEKANIYHTLIKQPVLLGYEAIKGIDCYKIKGTDNRGETIIWIAKKDFLIRKVETETKINPAKLIAGLHKLDSIYKARHIKSKANVASLIQRTSTLKEFKVTSTYLYFPSTHGKDNSILFKFRPNREAAI